MSKVQQNAAVEERRLRAVYEFFDNSDYKRALAECDRLNKKYKSKMGTTVNALRALALAKLGRWTEANKMLEDLLNEGPTEDATLSPMALALREVDRSEEIVPMYEAAVKKDPREELLNALFVLYVRERDRTKAKNIALQLNKLTDKRTYYFTSVMNQYLSGKEAPDERQKAMCFLLAEKMLERVPPEAGCELNLKYMILKGAGKTKEAMEFLEKHEKQLPMVDKHLDKMEFYLELKDFENAAKECEEAFKATEYSDHIWMKRRLEVAEKAKQDIKELARRLDGLLEAVEGKEKKREIFLNRILLFNKVGQSEKSVELMIQFFNQFHAKPWCTEDLIYFMNELPEKNRSDVLNGLKAKTENTDTLSFKILDFNFGKRPSANEMLENSWKLIDKHISAGCVQPSTSSNVNDGYMELGVDMAITAYKQIKDDNILLRIIKELEQAKERSPNGFRIKLRLLWCYLLLNAGSKVLTMSESLALKYIQWESMGYLVSPYVIRSCNIRKAVPLYRKMMQFHISSQREITDGCVNCYKSGTFHRIEDMESLKPKLENSFQLANSKIMKNLLASSLDKVVDEKSKETISVPSINWEKLVDNSDMKVLPEMYHDVFHTFEAKKKELIVKWNVLRMVSVAYDSEQRKTAFEDLSKLYSEEPKLSPNFDNAFAYFMYPLIHLESDKFITLVSERTKLVTDMKLESLTQLSDVITCAFEYIFAISCLAVVLNANKAVSATLKKNFVQETSKFLEIQLPLSKLLPKDEVGSSQKLQEDYEIGWSYMTNIIKSLEKFVK